MTPYPIITRREFILGSAGLLLSASFARASEPREKEQPEPIIDIHQHSPYSGRTGAEMIAHQRRIGVTTTILLPAGSVVDRRTTHGGNSNGLAAGVGGNETALEIVREHPGEFYFFANEVPDLPNAREEIEKYLKLGAIGIGEQKFGVDSDSKEIESIAEIARDYGVPVLLHFQEGRYNSGLERFHKILEKFPDVNFLGHAQTWWGHIDKEHDPKVLYPKGPVVPGGLTDRLLSDYPNMFADQSAGSGLNALLRDEDHARWFLEKHQDKILFGTDCSDAVGAGAQCQGAQTLAAIKRLAPDKAAERKILYENAKALLKI
ncbi:MAG TPA: amidohydrolase family protein [Opitutales bacterium]|nr:amidohydrolase family protein [Opitutales bacterium]